ncbi:unnamed protein product, partial [marine sediment metagenome]
MKEHMSITLDESTAHRLRRYAKQERRSISGVVGIAVEEYLSQRADPVVRSLSRRARFP